MKEKVMANDYLDPDDPFGVMLAKPSARAAMVASLLRGHRGLLQPPQAPDIPIPEVRIGSGNFSGGASGGWDDEPAKAPVRPQVLPQALKRVLAGAGGQSTPAAAPAAPQAPDPLQSRFDDLERQQKAALAEQDKLLEPPDRAAAEEAFKRRSSTAGGQMALALLAREAGLDPFVAHHLKAAAAAHEPMKMAGGTMTEQGFIEDPAYQQELRLRRADGRVKQIDQALQAVTTAQEKRRLEQEKIAAQRDLARERIEAQQFIANQMSADRRYAAELAHPPGAAGKLSAKEQSDLDAHIAMTQGLGAAVEGLKTAKDSTFGTGYQAGLIQEKVPGGGAIVAGRRDKPTRDALQTLTYITDEIRHGRFGAALTVPEKASASQYLPSEYDNVARLREKATKLQELVALNHQRLVARGGGMPPSPPPPADARGGTHQVSSDADYARLPSGATFIGPDGKTRRKP